MNTEQERAEFEAWYQHHHGDRDVYVLDETGEYKDKQVQGAFNVWQARAALQSPAVQGEPVGITDADILAIAGRVESCPVPPWWLKDDVAVGDVRAAVLRFARALLVAAPQPQPSGDVVIPCDEFPMLYDSLDALDEQAAEQPEHIAVRRHLSSLRNSIGAVMQAVVLARARVEELEAKAQPSGGAGELPDAVRVPLDSLHADVGYLIGRVMDESLTRDEAVAVIRSYLDEARAALAAQPSGVFMPHGWPICERR